MNNVKREDQLAASESDSMQQQATPYWYSHDHFLAHIGGKQHRLKVIIHIHQLTVLMLTVDKI